MWEKLVVFVTVPLASLWKSPDLQKEYLHIEVTAELVLEATVSQAAGQTNGLLLWRGRQLLSFGPLGFVVSVGFEFKAHSLVVSGADLAFWTISCPCRVTSECWQRIFFSNYLETWVTSLHWEIAAYLPEHASAVFLPSSFCWSIFANRIAPC